MLSTPLSSILHNNVEVNTLVLLIDPCHEDTAMFYAAFFPCKCCFCISKRESAGRNTSLRGLLMFFIVSYK